MDVKELEPGGVESETRSISGSAAAAAGRAHSFKSSSPTLSRYTTSPDTPSRQTP